MRPLIYSAIVLGCVGCWWLALAHPLWVGTWFGFWALAAWLAPHVQDWSAVRRKRQDWPRARVHVETDWGN